MHILNLNCYFWFCVKFYKIFLLAYSRIEYTCTQKNYLIQRTKCLVNIAPSKYLVGLTKLFDKAMY